LTSANALDIIKDYDVVADGTDNFPTRYLVNDACVLLDKVNVYASIYRFEGQVSVFNYKLKNGERGPNYRDLFPEPPPPGLVPSCAEGGVIGVLPGIMGSLQANEVIKVITGVGDPLSGRLFVMDAASFETRVLKLGKDKKNPLNGENPTQTELIDYEQFCGINTNERVEQSEVKEIDVFQLQSLNKSKESFQLIDVREPYEYEIANIKGDLMPLKTIEEFIGKISRDRKVVIHCRSGVRSAQAILALEEKYGFENLYNLKGGILDYADKIDTSLAKY
jgi:rhodanese-related sulfurtransferase